MKYDYYKDFNLILTAKQYANDNRKRCWKI